MSGVISFLPGVYIEPNIREAQNPLYTIYIQFVIINKSGLIDLESLRIEKNADLW